MNNLEKKKEWNDMKWKMKRNERNGVLNNKVTNA